jgi:glycosyltransferase involved in cell wall biosynthesis
LGSLKLSVALVAYNRERFLTQQLRSILNQNRSPDELIIGDDASTDRTANVISAFATQAPFPVRWYVNEHNEGYSRNLERAIQLCSGDVIVFCDDDDVCLPDKLRVTEDVFQRSPGTGLMIGDSALVDDQMNPLGLTLWDTARFTCANAEAVLKDPICILARHFIAAGHVMAFRQSLTQYILPFPEQLPPKIFCDVWIALILASVAEVVCVPRPLVAHRLHGDQIAGVRAVVSPDERRVVRALKRQDIGEFVRLVQEVIGRVSALTDTPLAKRNLQGLTRWAEHLKMQARLSPARYRRLLPVARAVLVGQYHRYSRGFLTAARDLLLLR